MIRITMLGLLLSSITVSAEEFNITCIQQGSTIECAQPNGSIRYAQTIDPEKVEQSFQKPPFETPKWAPNEEMKKRALMRAYELNGNKMCCGSIDVSQDPVVTGRTVITPETEFNVLDATVKKKN